MIGINNSITSKTSSLPILVSKYYDYAVKGAFHIVKKFENAEIALPVQ